MEDIKGKALTVNRRARCPQWAANSDRQTRRGRPFSERSVISLNGLSGRANPGGYGLRVNDLLRTAGPADYVSRLAFHPLCLLLYLLLLTFYCFFILTRSTML